MDWLNSVKIPNGVSKKVPSFDLGKVLKIVSYHVCSHKSYRLCGSLFGD